MSKLNLNINDKFDKSEDEVNTAPRRGQREEAPVHSDIYDPFADVSASQLFGQLVNPASGSEQFNNFYEGLKKANTSDAINIVPFAREVYTDLSFSVIAIVRNCRVRLSKSAPQHSFVMAQLLILEGTGEVPREYTNNDNPRRPFTITPTAEDANNGPLQKLVIETLLEQFGKDGATAAYLIDPVVIRRTFDSSKKEEVETQLATSVVAVETRSQVRVPGFVDFNFVKKLGATDLVLPVTVAMSSGEDRKDSQGLPIHTDAVIDVHVERSGSRRQGPVMNSPQDSRLLCQTGVMVDLVPVDPDLLEENRTRGSRRNRIESEAAWAPRSVVTNIEQFQTRTSSGIWFATASAAELARDRNWAATFRGFKGKKDEKNLRDIGLVNIEAKLEGDDGARFGRPIDTRASSFDDRQMGTLLDNTVTRSMMIAVDCMTTGNQAYYTTNLYLAARGRGENRNRAINEIINSLRSATDNWIDDYIDLSKVDIVTADDKLHVGFWYDNTGRMRDLRELDNYLAIAATAGENNPELIAQWADTWYNDSVSEDVRMSDRLVILKGASSGSVVVTGTALRVTLNNSIIDAFSRAMEDGKLPLLSRAAGDGDAFSTQRSISRVTANSLYSGSGFSRRGNSDRRSERSKYAGDRW